MMKIAENLLEKVCMEKMGWQQYVLMVVIAQQ